MADPEHRLPARKDEGTAVALKELRTLSARVEEGDKEARKELRQILEGSSSQLNAETANFTRRAEWMMVKTVSAGEPLMEEALTVRLERMRAEIAGETPTMLEALLAERVVACWLLVELLEALVGAQLSPDNKDRRVPMSFLKHAIKWQESAHRRYLSAIKTLVQIRKLGPAVQINMVARGVRAFNLPTAGPCSGEHTL